MTAVPPDRPRPGIPAGAAGRPEPGTPAGAAGRPRPGTPAGPSPVVALHSLFFDGGMFDDLRDRAGRVVHAPDHRGQGSRRHETGDLSVHALADDVVELVESLGEPVHLVGSSMGAYVAMATAARVPHLVRSCVLSAATADSEQRPELFADLVAALRTDGPAAMVERLERTMFGSLFVETPSTERDRWRRHFAALDGSVADAAEQVFARPPMWSEVLAIKAPVLLLAGRLDTAKSPEDMQHISDRLGCPPPVVLPQSGHTPFVEQPREVAYALVAFWSAVEETREELVP